MPLHPAQQILRRRVETARADDHRAGRHIRQRLAVEAVPLHQPALLRLVRREGRVRHAERPGDMLGQEIGIGLLRRFRQGDRQHVEGEVRVEHAGPRREQERLLAQPGGERLAGDRREGIVGRARFMRDLARQPRRLRGDVDQSQIGEVWIGAGAEIGRGGADRLRQGHGSVRGELGQNLAGEGLGDRADAHDGVAVRRLAAVARRADPMDRRLAVAHRGDDEAGYLVLEVEDIAGERDGLIEQGVRLRRAGMGREACHRRQQDERRAARGLEDDLRCHASPPEKTGWLDYARGRASSPDDAGAVRLVVETKAGWAKS